MRTLALSTLTALVANALSLGLSAALLDDFTVSTWWYVAAVVMFTVVGVALRMFVEARMSSLVRPYTVAGGLVLTFVGLFLTHLVVPGDGFAITGWLTWLGVTVFVWAAGVAFGDVQPVAPASAPGMSPEQRAAERDRPPAP